jgi:hypothetical protein
MARAKRQRDRTVLDGVGKYSKKMDMALPGQHTHTLYDALGRKEANILAWLNRYLHRIGVVESDRCAYG